MKKKFINSKNQYYFKKSKNKITLKFFNFKNIILIEKKKKNYIKIHFQQFFKAIFQIVHFFHFDNQNIH